MFNEGTGQTATRDLRITLSELLLTLR